MIDFMSDFAFVREDVEDLREAIKAVLALDVDPALRQQLEAADRSLKDSLAEAAEALPQAQADLQKEVEEIQASMARTEAGLVEVEQALAAAAAGAASAGVAAAVIAEPPLDPALGGRIRDQLLERYGPTRAAEPTTKDDGSVWRTSEGWSESVAAPPSPTPPAPPKAEPPRKDKKTGQSVWEGMSEMDLE